MENRTLDSVGVEVFATCGDRVYGGVCLDGTFVVPRGEAQPGEGFLTAAARAFLQTTGYTVINPRLIAAPSSGRLERGGVLQVQGILGRDVRSIGLRSWDAENVQLWPIWEAIGLINSVPLWEQTSHHRARLTALREILANLVLTRQL